MTPNSPATGNRPTNRFFSGGSALLHRRAMPAHLCSRDVDIIPMDELHRWLTERDFSRRFVCFTLDDGYRDNRDFALPAMRECKAPFAVHVAGDFAESWSIDIPSISISGYGCLRSHGRR
jgi:peptidoglycan/xylan/chitin deacetylase (PgdA/CDA1 family)